jgi:flagellar hook-associated protein 1 FlgK
LDAIDGISATALPTGELVITADSAEAEFFFANDTSGVLAALGLNVFFAGSTAADLGVSQFVRDDPARFAAARIEDTPDSDGSDDSRTANARILANLLDAPIVSPYGYSLSGIYDQMVEETAQGSSITRAAAEGARVFEQTLRGEKLSISGVNIDEEAIDLMAHQHSFQASARLIATISELLDVLVTL